MDLECIQRLLAGPTDQTSRRVYILLGLVLLAIDGENRSYVPRVDANQFLTVAKQYYGHDPPD